MCKNREVDFNSHVVVCEVQPKWQERWLSLCTNKGYTSFLCVGQTLTYTHATCLYFLSTCFKRTSQGINNLLWNCVKSCSRNDPSYKQQTTDSYLRKLENYNAYCSSKIFWVLSYVYATVKTGNGTIAGNRLWLPIFTAL